MKFAFLIMGDFDVRQDYAAIHGGDACIVGVADIEPAPPRRGFTMQVWAALNCAAPLARRGPAVCRRRCRTAFR